MHKCPVCGYGGLAEPPEDFYICSCCGTEFGNDDFDATHEALRNRWISLGAPWFSVAVAPPKDWNPYLQLIEAGFGFNINDDAANASSAPVRIEPILTKVSVRLRMLKIVGLDKDNVSDVYATASA